MDNVALARVRREIINKVIKIEGGKSNHKHDRGGKTNYGITATTAQRFGVADVYRITKEQAYQIYETGYWQPVRGDSLALLSPAVAAEVFDTGVNCGPKQAGLFLQRALNLLNHQATFYADIQVDGKIGQQTLDALSDYLRRRSNGGERVLLTLLNAFQAVYYAKITEQNPNNESFIYGWIDHRVNMPAMDKQQPQDSDMVKQVTPRNDPPTGWTGSATATQQHTPQQWPHPADMAAPTLTPEQQLSFAQQMEREAKTALAKQGKSSWRSKLIYTGLGLGASGASLLGARYGLNLPADTLLNVATVLLIGGGSTVAILRRWFTHTFLY